MLEALFEIQEKQDASLAFRYCCRAAICGSCAMYINGRYRLACQTNVAHLESDVITVEPLPHVPRGQRPRLRHGRLLRQVRVHQALADPQLADAGVGAAAVAARACRKLDMPIDCILCGCCYSSCPSVWGEENYLGPAALLKAYRFEVDSRDEAGRERLPRFDNERGVYRCHTITNCVEACPKELNPTEGIQWLKKAVVRRRVFGRSK